MGAAGRSAPLPEGGSEPVATTHLQDVTRLRPAAFDELPGWSGDDIDCAYRAFRASAAHIVEERPELRPARAPDEALLATCRAAIEARTQARAFFEAQFTPWEILPHKDPPFFTGYFEPETDGAPASSEAFPAPLLARPADLVTLPRGERLAGSEIPLTSARRLGDRLAPYPDRAAIEAGALDGQGLELVWLRDRVEVFIIQVQGSARVRLPGAGAIRLRYAGRNGWPYTSIGRALIEQGAISADEMSLEALTSWLRAHPGEAEAIMRRNRSYVFFAIDAALAVGEGPVGGQGQPLTAHRSIAVDRDLWSYGLPFWIDTDRPEPEGGFGRWQRLMIAQDTGAAIVGPGRVDVFFGSGAAAGAAAGRQRHRGRLFVLRPRAAAPIAP
ncbi:MAG: murein transglycosylase A [Hyphomicrobiales bacterium]